MTTGDIRGEAKHSNDKTTDPSTGGMGTLDEKILERAMTSLENKVNALEDIIREQKRTIKHQGKQLDNLGANAGQSSAPRSAPVAADHNSNLTNLLETLTSKVNYLVEHQKKDM